MNLADALPRLVAGIGVFLEQSARNHVYWVERTSKVGQLLTLNAAPIDIAPALRQMLFREGCTCVMTSATLGVGRKDLAYFRNRVGAEEAEPLQLGSPFNFQSADEAVCRPQNARSAGRQVMKKRWSIGSNISSGKPTATPLFCLRIIGHAGLAAKMENFCAEHDLNLLVQGGGLPRTKLLDQFKSTPRSVLFGTDSFWRASMSLATLCGMSSSRVYLLPFPIIR